jgi:hypothetical protein
LEKQIGKGVFVTWCWRRMWKIKWTEKVKNEEAYRRIGEENTLWSTIRQRRTRWVGHVIETQQLRRKYNGGKN